MTSYTPGKGLLRDMRRGAAAARRYQNNQIRQQNAELRHQEALRKQFLRQQKEQQRNNGIALARKKTDEATSYREMLCSILEHGAQIPLSINWDLFKKNDGFGRLRPKPPQLYDVPNSLTQDDFNPIWHISIFDLLRKNKRDLAKEQCRLKFQKLINERDAEIQGVMKKNIKLEEDYDAQVDAWQKELDAFYTTQTQFNSRIDKYRHGLQAGERESVEFYFKGILNALELPRELKIGWLLEYSPESGILIVDYDIPTKEIIPRIKMVKYYVTTQALSESYLKDKDVDQLYDDLLFQIAIRISNDIYVSDTYNQVQAVVFNGIYTGIDDSTGLTESKCIISMQTTKSKFKEIDVRRVDARSCFLKFKGISGMKLSDYIPIAPIISINKEDRRFTANKNLSIADGMNIAAMDWEDFEHLIRELFEKEFASNGSEIKITRASRDGGIDAIMFDPDPIRGGKYIIQAKRYTNIVGVSAVRDLYGTIISEGAIKGILVTTANYGHDSYEFAKDKPISLLNGSNLLFMLQKHGYQVRIDLDEAKRILSNNN